MSRFSKEDLVLADGAHHFFMHQVNGAGLMWEFDTHLDRLPVIRPRDIGHVEYIQKAITRFKKETVNGRKLEPDLDERYGLFLDAVRRYVVNRNQETFNACRDEVRPKDKRYPLRTTSVRWFLEDLLHEARQPMSHYGYNQYL